MQKAMETTITKQSKKEAKRELKKAKQTEVQKTMEKEMQKMAMSNTSYIKKTIKIKYDDDDEESEITIEDYENILTSFKYLLTNGETVNAIKLLKEIKTKTDGSDITCVLDDLLPWGTTLFYLFVKSESKEMMNSFYTFDKIIPNKSEQDIIDLFIYKIIDIEFAAIVNKCSMSKVLYMIIQFSGYNDSIINYIFLNYCEYVSYENLIKHMLFVNITNDIIVYIKAIKDRNLVLPEYITFQRVYESYKFMEANQDYSKITKSRFINVISVFTKICKQYNIMIPPFKDFKYEFGKLFNIFDNTHNISKAMDNLCIECYNYIESFLPWGLQAYYPEFNQTNIISLIK